MILKSIFCNCKIATLIIFLLFNSCNKNFKTVNKSKQDIKATTLKSKLKAKNFKIQLDGKKTNLYVLTNKNGVEVTFTNYGQRLTSIIVPDKNGKFEDVVLGFNSLERYISAREKYMGAFIGRYANRISKGNFSIDGIQYKLSTNNRENHLHGGFKGFNNLVWDVHQIKDNEIEFRGISPDGEEGYPGDLEIRVNYLLTDENEIIMSYYGVTNKPTIINLTHHSFFNLAGEGNGSIDNHLLMINANKYTPVDESLIPTGDIVSVQGTPFDFRKIKLIGEDIEAENQQLTFGKGYDHNFVLKENLIKNGGGLSLAARVIEPISGRVMEVFTSEPGLQFYSGNFLDGKTMGKSGKPYDFRGAFCLEPQHFPDSPNNPKFPKTLLLPGEEYKSVSIYKFSTTNQ